MGMGRFGREGALAGGLASVFGCERMGGLGGIRCVGARIWKVRAEVRGTGLG